MIMPMSGLSSLGVPGVPWHTQILADQLTLFQPGGTDYAHLITTGTPGFSDLPTALICMYFKENLHPSGLSIAPVEMAFSKILAIRL